MAKKKPSNLEIKLAERLFKDLGIKVKPIINRLRPTGFQLECGAMRFSFGDGLQGVYSDSTATEILNADSIFASDSRGCDIIIYTGVKKSLWRVHEP